MNPFSRVLRFSLGAFVLALPVFSSSATTLDDLKKLEIICFVPSYLPDGFKLTDVQLISDDFGPDESNQTHHWPLYGLEYGDGKRTFSIDSAREGIGDRNIMETEDSEDAEIHSKLFGTVYIVYTPKGKAEIKQEIISNWVEDSNMKAEKKKDAEAHPEIGRYHGFSATGISVAEFQKILDSLHPVKTDASPPSRPKETGGAPELNIHPKVFNMIDCWLSDSESPVLTEINLDAVEKNGNQFNTDDVKGDGEWTRSPTPDSKEGFMRFRVLESKGSHYKVEYQENGGGTLTTASIIEFDIQKRNIQRDGKPASIRVLRVTSYRDKK